MINDGQHMTTVCLVAATPMCAICWFSEIIVSLRLGEALKHLHSRWSSPSKKTLENLQGWHTSPVAAFCLAAGVSFAGNASSYRM